MRVNVFIIIPPEESEGQLCVHVRLLPVSSLIFDLNIKRSRNVCLSTDHATDPWPSNFQRFRLKMEMNYTSHALISLLVHFIFK